jgi:hypothetical protein
MVHNVQSNRSKFFFINVNQKGVVNLGVGGVTEVKPTLPKSLSNVKPVQTGGKYEYLTLYIDLQWGHAEMRKGNSVID